MRYIDLDKEQADALRRIWFVGDIHGNVSHLVRTIQAEYVHPAWIVFAGDIDIDHQPFRELLSPLKGVKSKIAFIHGNHDADSHKHWEMLHDCGDAVAISGKVVDMEGIKVAGLGGHFVGKAWKPPADPAFEDRQSAIDYSLKYGRSGSFNPVLNSAIFPEDIKRLSNKRADILITHEAPSCHHYGFAVLDELSRSMRVARHFHGHQHDDRTEEYRAEREKLGFDAVALGYCAIKNGLGEVIFPGVEGW